MNGLRTTYVICGLVATLSGEPLTAWEPAEVAADPCAAALSEKVREMVIQMKDRGWIGIEFGEGEPPVLTRVVAGGPAEAAGLEVGDLWIGVSDFEFAGRTREEVMKHLKPLIQPGSEFTVHVQRGDRRLALELRPVAIPHRILAQWIGGHLLDKYAADLVSVEP